MMIEKTQLTIKNGIYYLLDYETGEVEICNPMLKDGLPDSNHPLTNKGVDFSCLRACQQTTIPKADGTEITNFGDKTPLK